MGARLLTTRVLAVLLLGILTIGSSFVSTSAAQNGVISGPGYEKGQQSRNTLSFAIPQGWTEDKNAAAKLGLHSVLVPSRTKLENADRVITIAFQKRDRNKPGLDTLENFFRADMRDTLSKFPDAQFVRWQPSRLDPRKVNFMSLEMYGKKKNKPSPQHFVIVEAPDGYFSVSLTVESRDDLKLPLYDDFFNSLAIEPAH